MDVIKIGTDCLPLGLVENFDSMIWTERYYVPGDFELHTHDIEATLSFLPINSYISLADSVQIMLVEEHEIETDKDGIQTLTIRGRSLDSVLESRYWMTWLQQTNDTSIEITNPLDEVLYPVVQAMSIVNSNNDALWINRITYEPRHEIGSITYMTYADSVLLTAGDNVSRAIKKGPMDQVVRSVLAEIDAGLRSDRVLTLYNAQPGTALSIFKGRDLTQTAGGNYVIFSADNGDLTNVKYLKTVKNLKTVALGAWHQDILPDPVTGPPMVRHNSFDLFEDDYNEPSLLSGLDRKEIYVETRSVLNSDYTTDPYYGARDMARAELRKYQRTVFVTAEVSPTLASQYEYGGLYYLGDYITVRAGYGITADMQISEYTRISDNTGDRAYPTLTEKL